MLTTHIFNTKYHRNITYLYINIAYKHHNIYIIHNNLGFGASDFRNLYLSKNLTKNHAILEEEARIPIIYNAK